MHHQHPMSQGRQQRQIMGDEQASHAPLRQEPPQQPHHRLLRPGGRLLNFDGDYASIPAKAAADPQDVHAGIAPALIDDCNAIIAALNRRPHDRPQWDISALHQAGFQKVSCTPNIAPLVNVDPNLHFGGPALFELSALK